MVDYLRNFSHVVPFYDAYLFDVYGVLHNGEEASTEAINCLVHLAEQEKHVLIITNAPHRRQAVMTRLENFGIWPSMYQGLISAGELTRQALLERNDPWLARLGDGCYIIGTSLDEEILSGTGIYKVHTLEEADFILNCGANEWHSTLEDYLELLDEGITFGLPMICVNPDLIVFRGHTEELRGGYLAQYYARKGGKVYYYGKPYPKIYHKALEIIPDISPTRVLAIGDSFVTDYKGAENMGLDFLLCFGPLSAKELNIDWQTANTFSYEKISRKMKQVGYTPKYTALATLVW
jgi:HAD superfamily hydrolase (TIGR01459 family)